MLFRSHALETTDLGSSISPIMGLEPSNKELVFAVGLEGVLPDKAKDVEKLVMDSLESALCGGISQSKIDAALHQLEISQREISGGAMPLKDSVVLGLSKLTKVISINPEEQTAVVQPGVRNLAISEAADEFGLYYAPDPSSQIACTIGGNVAENAGGVHCLKYGLTLQNIESITILTIDGDELVF